MLAAPATPIPVTLIKSRRFMEFPPPDDVPAFVSSFCRRLKKAMEPPAAGFHAECHIAAQKARPGKGPGFNYCRRRQLAAGARADHEAVERVFGDLPPQILVRTIGLHR